MSNLRFMMRILNSYRFKHSLFIFLLAIVLIVLRWGWSELFPTSSSHHAVNGVVDLRGIDLEGSPPLYLNGEWDLYPGQLLTHQSFDSQEQKDYREVKVPGNWGSVSDNHAYGFGTYRLRILVDPLKEPVAFWLQGIQASSEVEINGVVTSAIGKYATSADGYTPTNVSYTASYGNEGTTEIELLIRVANYDEPYNGGLTRPIRFGAQSSLDYSRWYSIGFQLVVFIILVLHGLYALILYSFNSRERALLVAALFMLTLSVAILSGHDNVLMLWLPINYTWAIKIRLIALLWQNYCFLNVFGRFASNRPRVRWLNAYMLLLSAFTVLLVFSPAWLVYTLIHFHIFDAMYLIPFAWYLYLVGSMMVNKDDPDIIFMLLLATTTASNFIWSLVETAHNVTTVFYPIDIIAGLIGFSTYWFKKYIRNSRDNEELNLQLRKADKAKDQFLANTSHELRTPLHGIMNIAETIAVNEQHRLHADSLRSMELLITISRRMSHMLGDLLDVARLKEQRIALEHQAFAVQSVVPAIFDIFSFMVKGKPVRLVMDIDAATPPVWADEKRIVQIMYNLIHNAIKFTEAGTIRVSAEQKGNRLVLLVSDTGIGMDATTQAKAFTPYEQGDVGIGDGSGLGLGLSICKQLVELHGGALTVSSDLGAGSVFKFDLALADATHVSTSPSVMLEETILPLESITSPVYDAAIRLAPTLEDDTTLLNHGKSNILVVDDDPVNLSVLVGILSMEPYIVTTTSSALEALELIGKRQWDLLIADVMMPHMSGYELAQRVRERYSLSELPIVLLTARAQPEDIYAGFVAGANDYVTKPADAVELKYRVRSWTGLKQSINDKLRMEAAYLHAQIQPHFIFNTLHSIMALSTIDTDRMRKMGEAFASFLRISIDFVNTDELVELSHELELVEAYLLIEKERFEERLQIQWEIHVDKRWLLPPLTIQPLVENAVKHGLMKQFRGGTVTIRIIQQEDSMVIQVEDDGKGMDEAEILKAFDTVRKGKRGVGLANTNRRLLARYGRGLSIHSRSGEGLIASFVIPRAFNKEEIISK
ncbi:response regulator [Paenibacillus sp. PR3]|uniref:histidine kinase n=1 Tax=Paenibacillus terricola TaxID=2763503 RepID=A0ABR8N0L6_9BACL|nr:ATP-binding protein [Paenibacillus terricola]MBD3920872.1 response regulator [Paenibacillus terricola]